ncbi:MAG: ferrous iron transport protein A, partial [Candidatus Lokiarchaeota archaeon]|nr:ferrous iron transport protein A [Candidatus Lokiarchaeota archaeon]
MEQTHTTMMLSEVADGKSLRVCKVDADKDAKRRLANLGLLPGVEIRKRHAAPLHGPVEIE